MEIVYNGKKPIESILSKAANQPCSLHYEDEKSLLIRGDNFQVLSSLIKTFGAKIDLIYIDPPYNTKQVFTVDEGRQNSISKSNNGTVAYSDNLTKEQYLEFMRERFVLLRELLSEKGSIFVHIDLKMGHYMKIIMDEIFGEDNFRNDITRVKSNPKNFSRKAFGNEKDMILFYVKNTEHNIWNEVRYDLDIATLVKRFPKLDSEGRRYTTIPLHAPGETKSGNTGQEWRGQLPPQGRHWRTDPIEFDRLDELGLIEWSSTGNPRIKKFADEHKGVKPQDIWVFKDPQNPKYPTEKNLSMLELIVKQCSIEGSIVLDCFCGSGSTLEAAQKHKRKWIGVDQSLVAIDVAKKRMASYNFNYIECKDN